MKNTTAIVNNASKAGVVVPAFNMPYLPMVEPVIRAVVDQDSFAQDQQPRRYRHCGAELREGARLCPRCGETVGE